MKWGQKATVLPGFDDFAALNAPGANPQPLRRSFDNSADTLQIHVPPAISNVMSVADAMAELRSSTAKFTILCHKTGISFDLQTCSLPISKSLAQTSSA